MTEKKISKELQEKIQELQLMQQKLSIFAAQKQQLQLQVLELENALKELEKAKSPVYKLTGELLIEKPAKDIKKELSTKKSDLDLHIKTLETQEKKIKDRALDLQKEVTKTLAKK